MDTEHMSMEALRQTVRDQRKALLDWERLALGVGNDYYKLLAYLKKLEPDMTGPQLLKAAGVGQRVLPAGEEFSEFVVCAECDLPLEKERAHVLDAKTLCAECMVVALWDVVAMKQRKLGAAHAEGEELRRLFLHRDGCLKQREDLARDLFALLQYHRNNFPEDATYFKPSYEEIRAAVGICEFRE